MVPGTGPVAEAPRHRTRVFPDPRSFAAARREARVFGFAEFLELWVWASVGLGVARSRALRPRVPLVLRPVTGSRFAFGALRSEPRRRSECTFDRSPDRHALCDRTIQLGRIQSPDSFGQAGPDEQTRSARIPAQPTPSVRPVQPASGPRPRHVNARSKRKIRPADQRHERAAPDYPPGSQLPELPLPLSGEYLVNAIFQASMAPLANAARLLGSHPSQPRPPVEQPLLI